MWVERHPDRKPRWPDGVRLPILISVHHQSEEAPCPMPEGVADPFDFSERQYGGRRGAWRILELLQRHGVKSTWFICGATAEKYPEITRAVDRAGHAIGGHGYEHEFMCNLSPEAELAVMEKTVSVFEGLLGKPLRGWRTCFPSHSTIDLILTHFDFQWDGSRRNDDLPYLIEGAGRAFVEIPFTYDADSSLSVRITNPLPPNPYSTWDSNPPEFTLRAMKAWLAALYERGRDRAVILPLTIHDFITGRPSRADALEEFVADAKTLPGVVFTTHDELASWWHAQYVTE